VGDIVGEAGWEACATSGKPLADRRHVQSPPALDPAPLPPRPPVKFSGDRSAPAILVTPAPFVAAGRLPQTHEHMHDTNVLHPAVGGQFSPAAKTG
jgi:hypothetical protein